MLLRRIMAPIVAKQACAQSIAPQNPWHQGTPKTQAHLLADAYTAKETDRPARRIRCV